MKKYTKFLFSLFFYSTAAFGVSLTIKASIGVSAVNSMIVALADVSTIKVGTVTIAVNMLFFLAYMILSKFRYPVKYLLQVGFLLFFGTVINFYVYHLFLNWQITSYWFQVILLSLGVIIGGLSVGMVVHYNIITFPIESFCLELENHTKKKFAFYRYSVDVVTLTISILLTWLMHLPLYAREGTLISMLLLTMAMNFSKQRMSRAEEKRNNINA